MAFGLIPGTFTKKTYLLVAVISELCRPLLRVCAHAAVGAGSSPPDEWRKVLILGSRHIGDVLYRTAFLEDIRRFLPRAELCYMAGELSGSVLQTNPNLDRVITVKETRMQGAIANDDFRRLREEKFDAVLITSPIRYWTHLINAVRMGIPNRICYIHKGLSGLVTLPVGIRFPSTHVEYIRQFVEGLTGSKVTAPPCPKVYLTDADRREARDFHDERGIPRGTRILAVFCSTRQDVELWPDEKIAECVRVVVEKSGVRPVFLGTKSDARMLESIAKKVGYPCEVAGGTFSVRGLAAFLSGCSAILTPDSGPRHLGNAVGVPVVYIRNLVSMEEELSPYCDNEIDVAPCGSGLSKAQQRSVLNELDPQQVARVILGRIGAKHVSAGPGLGSSVTRLRANRRKGES